MTVSSYFLKGRLLIKTIALSFNLKMPPLRQISTFGIVQGGINTSASDGGIFVKSLYPNGPADLDGRIQVGHKILSVNGISLQGVTHKQVGFCSLNWCSRQM